MPAPLVAALVSAGMDIVGNLIDDKFPNTAEREQKRLEYELKFQEAANQINLAQIAVNQEEANSPELFVSGWRPFIGWVCGCAFAYHFILQPLLAFTLASTGQPVTLPVFDMETLTTVLMGMLGLGGLRTIEKVRGVR